MNIKKVPKRYRGFRVKIQKSKIYVASWNDKRKIIYLNYYYVIKPTVDIVDVKAILNHELEELKQHIKNKQPMLIAHSLANKREKKYLKKRKHKFPGHQKEIIQVYKKGLVSEDAPYYNARI